MKKNIFQILFLTSIAALTVAAAATTRSPSKPSPRPSLTPQASSSPQSKPQTSETMPTIDTWIAEVSEKIDELVQSIPLTMAAVQATGKDSFKYIEGISKDKFKGISYLRFLSTADLDWNQKINAPFLKDKKGIDLIFAGTGANILFVGGNKQNVLVLGGKQKKLVKTDVKTLKADPASFVSEVFGALGYDGVVLDQKNDFFLIGIHSKAIGRVGDQALAIQNSEGQFVVTKKDNSGAALLNSVAVKNGFGIFKILLKGDQATIPIGTKVVSERRKN